MQLGIFFQYMCVHNDSIHIQITVLFLTVFKLFKTWMAEQNDCKGIESHTYMYFFCQKIYSAAQQNLNLLCGNAKLEIKAVKKTVAKCKTAHFFDLEKDAIEENQAAACTTLH